MRPKPVEALIDWSRGAVQKAQFRLQQAGPKPLSVETFRNPGAPSVTMLPGVWEEWGALTNWADCLHDAGFDVRFVPQLDRVFGTMGQLTDKLLSWAQEQQIGQTVIVAHSKGGLVGKNAIVARPDQFTRLVACGTPFRGAPLARLMPVASQMSDLTPENEEITSLANDLDSNRKTIQVEARWDQNVPKVGILPGAIHLTAPVDGHNALLKDKETAKLITEIVKYIYKVK